MQSHDFSFTLHTKKGAPEVFKAIQNVRGWWSGLYDEEIIGSTGQVHDEFSFRAGGGAHYSRQKLVEVIRDQKITWLITDSELSFVDRKYEWTGTRVMFEIIEKEGLTEIRFTHQGLTPAFACYEACAPAWTRYLQEKLLPLIEQPAVEVPE